LRKARVIQRHFPAHEINHVAVVFVVKLVQRGFEHAGG